MSPHEVIALAIIGGASIVSGALAFRNYPTVAAWLFIVSVVAAMCLATS